MDINNRKVNNRKDYTKKRRYARGGTRGLDVHNGSYREPKLIDAFEFWGKDISVERFEFYKDLIERGV